MGTREANDRFLAGLASVRAVLTGGPS
jgi:hypothetical protein